MASNLCGLAWLTFYRPSLDVRLWCGPIIPDTHQSPRRFPAWMAHVVEIWKYWLSHNGWKNRSWIKRTAFAPKFQILHTHIKRFVWVFLCPYCFLISCDADKIKRYLFGLLNGIYFARQCVSEFIVLACYVNNVINIRTKVGVYVFPTDGWLNFLQLPRAARGL